MTVPHSLTELEAELVTHAAGSIGREATRDAADGLMFLCPKCFSANRGPRGTHRVVCWFRGRVPDDATPGPGRWELEGSDLSNFTLRPSVQLTGGGCDWHGFVTNGSAA